MQFIASQLKLKPCPSCNNDVFDMRQNETGYHTGAYCTSCGRWIKWLGQKEIQKIVKPLQRGVE